jgi:hypothetical protein
MSSWCENRQTIKAAQGQLRFERLCLIVAACDGVVQFLPELNIQTFQPLQLKGFKKMTQSTTAFHVGTAVPAILAAQAAYQESLRQLASWVRTDKSRSESMLPDTREHLLAGLAVLESVSTTAGDSVQVHNSVFAHLPYESMTVEQLKCQRDRYAGTAPHLARLFDQLGLRLAHLGTSVAHTGATYAARLAN